MTSFWEQLSPKKILPVWQRLRQTNKPIALYGMGLGAEKILRVMDSMGISVSAVFASDAFVRGHSFHGFPVLRFSELCRQFEDPLVVIAFGSNRDDVLSSMQQIASRFETVAPDVPVAGDLLFTPSLLQQHRELWEESYALLADDISRKTFCQVIAFKLDGDISHLVNCQTPREEAWEHLLTPGPKETFVDLGAYTGDTIREFLSYTGGAFRSLLAMEPDAKNFRRLEKYCKTLSQDPQRIRCFPYGAWNRKEICMFRRQSGRNSALSFVDPPQMDKRSVTQLPVQMEALDHLIGTITPTILKLDVEGAEYQALEGSQETIRRFRPRLLVSAYHRSDDLIRLPLLIRNLNGRYRFYLRHHPYVPAWETNLYCV